MSDSFAVRIFKLEVNACTDKLAKALKPHGWHGVIVAWDPDVEEAWILTQTVGSSNDDLEKARALLKKALGDKGSRAAEVCRVKAHGWRNEANTLEPETEEWRKLIAKAEAGEELSRFFLAALSQPGEKQDV